ncbi:MAG: hypothetical protein ABSH20_14890 [Tepidisphaeraceae bacterium]|jgi:galactose mutarotase-like enzyme
MSHSVTIENDAFRMEVWPEIGGKVASLVDKADNHELFFSYPAEIPDQRPRYDNTYADSWCAGWDECFPSVAPSRYVGFPYDGIASPDHGELWGLPTTAVPTRNGITTVWHGLRFGYRLTRKLHLEDQSILADYTLVNLAPFPFRFVWAQHVLLALRQQMVVEIPAAGEWRFSHNASGERKDEPFRWPRLGDLDLSLPESLPAGKGWKVFSSSPIDAPAVLRYPARSRRLTIEITVPENLKCYWGVWISTGGWAQHRQLSLEPTTGRFDELDRCIRDHSAAMIDPLGKMEWQVKWTTGAG